MISDPNPGIAMRIVPMDEVLAGESVDSFAYLRCLDVEDVLEHKILDDGFQDLYESVEKHGLAAGFEPTWDGTTIREGHHRLAVLWKMGAQWAPVQDTLSRGEYFVAPDGSTPGKCAHCIGCDSWY